MVRKEQAVEQIMLQSGASREFAERAHDRLMAQVRGESCPVCEAGLRCDKH